MMKNIFGKLGKTLLVILLVSVMIAGSAFADGAAEPFYKKDDLFTSRDLEQTASLSESESLTVASGSDIRITKAGVYVLSGSASDVTVYVEAGDDDKIQLVLDSLTLTNSNFPCIYVVSADKVFVTVSADSSLSVTESFREDDGTDVSGVIFSRDDLVLNGTASLKIVSSGSGVICKDDLKITGGTYVVEAASNAFDANDSIRIADGTFTLTAGNDALHAETKKDESKGYVYIGDGSFTISAGDDGIFATSVLQVDAGVIEITAEEGVNATAARIIGGTVTVNGEALGSF